jgi:hypothetical protein
VIASLDMPPPNQARVSSRNFFHRSWYTIVATPHVQKPEKNHPHGKGPLQVVLPKHCELHYYEDRIELIYRFDNLKTRQSIPEEK